MVGFMYILPKNPKFSMIPIIHLIYLTLYTKHSQNNNSSSTTNNVITETERNFAVLVLNDLLSDTINLIHPT